MSPRTVLRTATAVGLVVVMSTVTAGCGHGAHRVAAEIPAPPASTTSSTPAVPTTTAPAPVAVVAQARVGHLAVFAKPTDPSPSWHLPNPRPLGGPLVLLATNRQPGWVQALLPIRPNGTRGWVREADVSLTQHLFRIVVQLGAHGLAVYNGFDKVADIVVGVGTQATPTPRGLYYTVDFVKLDDPNGPYGAYAYGLSGFSDVLTSFGGGPGQLAIHGTNEPDKLGTSVSHGCIRMSNADITKLANLLPLGVPVQVQA